VVVVVPRKPFATPLFVQVRLLVNHVVDRGVSPQTGHEPRRKWRQRNADRGPANQRQHLFALGVPLQHRVMVVLVDHLVKSRRPVMLVEVKTPERLPLLSVTVEYVLVHNPFDRVARDQSSKETKHLDPKI
jgi:hypothetical protein